MNLLLILLLLIGITIVSYVTYHSKKKNTKERALRELLQKQGKPVTYEDKKRAYYKKIKKKILKKQRR